MLDAEKAASKPPHAEEIEYRAESRAMLPFWTVAEMSKEQELADAVRAEQNRIRPETP